MRALIALGNADVGDVNELIPLDDMVTVVGGSSDYLIVDVSDCRHNINVGDIIEFYPKYVNMLHMTSSNNISIRYIN